MEVAATWQSIVASQEALRLIATTLQLTSYLWPEQANIQNHDSFDFIIVGAVTAGSVIANRLSEDPESTVLLIEAGGDPPVETTYAGLAYQSFRSHADWNYTSENLNVIGKCGQVPYIDLNLGKMLGGCSSNGYATYTRGIPEDYDEWANITNDDSWRYINVLPYFIKSEKLRNTKIKTSPFRRLHGYQGNIEVTRQTDKYDYLKAFSELGYNVDTDLNSVGSIGVAPFLTTVGSDKIKQTTAYTYLHPIKDRPNLLILKYTQVVKIDIENYKAVGVKAVIEKDTSTTMTFTAKKEVIISAGEINTAKLLLLSGIGPRSHLENLNIPVIADLPVGKNLQEHLAVSVIFKLKKLKKSMHAINPYEAFPSTEGNMIVKDKNIMYRTEMAAVDAQTLLALCIFGDRFTYEVCQAMYDDCKDMQIIHNFVYKPKPKSKGTVTLRSADPKDPPIVDLNDFGESEDLEDLIDYVQDFVRVLHTSYFKEQEADIVNFGQCNEFEKLSRDFIKCLIQCMSTSIFERAGTCAMQAVVDSRLRVYGIDNLRVSDTSIMPVVVSGGTFIPTVMIAEKASDMIKEDNGIQV